MEKMKMENNNKTILDYRNSGLCSEIEENICSLLLINNLTKIDEVALCLNRSIESIALLCTRSPIIDRLKNGSLLLSIKEEKNYTGEKGKINRLLKKGANIEQIKEILYTENDKTHKKHSNSINVLCNEIKRRNYFYL